MFACLCARVRAKTVIKRTVSYFPVHWFVILFLVTKCFNLRSKLIFISIRKPPLFVDGDRSRQTVISIRT